MPIFIGAYANFYWHGYPGRLFKEIMAKNYYQILGIRPTATSLDIRDAYKKRFPCAIPESGTFISPCFSASAVLNELNSA